jgi:hypothetical protein
MTAETALFEPALFGPALFEPAPQPDPRVRAQGGYQQMVRYGIVLAAAGHIVLHDRRFHVAVITGVIGVVAWADLIHNRKARPVRRVVHWYGSIGADRKLAKRAVSWPARAMLGGNRGQESRRRGPWPGVGKIRVSYPAPAASASAIRS